MEPIHRLVKDDLQSVDQILQHWLQSEIPLINTISRHIVQSGGKRLRPVVLLLSAGCFGYRGQAHTQLAAVIEFVHTATLLHDDVVDDSGLRRGQPTANTVWGNSASILVGDFVYSRAFQMMVEIGDLAILNTIAKTTNRITEGEILQLMHCKNPDTTETDYFRIIRGKTAALFSVACEVGAFLGTQDQAQVQAFADYGSHLGTAFQLIDDAMDFTGTPEQMGKNLGDDLAEGKPTLPLIYSLHHGNPEQRQLIQQAITQGEDLQDLSTIKEVIEATGAIDYITQLAHDETARALNALASVPQSPHRDALLTLAELALERQD